VDGAISSDIVSLVAGYFVSENLTIQPAKMHWNTVTQKNWLWLVQMMLYITQSSLVTRLRCGGIFTLSPRGEWNIVISVSVCLSVCLLLVVVGCVLDDILGTTRPNFTKFLCMLPVVVACSSSIGVVLSVLTSYFHMAHCLYTYNSTVVPPRHKVTIEHY